MARLSRTSFTLENEYLELFRRICSATRRSQTDELRLMIDSRAVALGFDPIQEVDPKRLALLREGLQLEIVQ